MMNVQKFVCVWLSAVVSALVAHGESSYNSYSGYSNKYTLQGVKYSLGCTYANLNKSSFYAYNVQIYGTSSSNYGNLTIPDAMVWYSNGSARDKTAYITRIRAGAFSGLQTLTGVEIPAGITTIGQPCFKGCSNLKYIKIGVGIGDSYSSQDGVLFDGKKTALKKYPEGKNGASYVVPATVTELGQYCFYKTKLSTIQFQGNAPTCGSDAFTGSSSLQGLLYPQGASGWSSTWNGVKTYAIPTRVSGLSATQGTSDSAVTVTWTENAVATSYKVYRSATTSGVKTLLGSVTGSTVYRDTAVDAGTKYSYTVVAINGPAVGAESAAVTGWAAEPVQTYTITFDANGGTGGATITRKAGESYGTLPTPTRVGYVFAGWQEMSEVKDEVPIVKPISIVVPVRSGSPSKSSVYTDVTISADTKATKTVTYWARWRPVEYIVRFDANGGSGTMADQEFTYDVGQTLSRNAFSNKTSTAVYRFDGWIGVVGGRERTFADGQSVTNLAASEGNVVLLRAQWAFERAIEPEITQVTVFFDGNGGTSTVTSHTYAVGAEYGLLPTATRAGYDFKGWYTDAKNGKLIAFVAKVSASVTKLYAHWTRKTYSVRFHYNSGSSDVSKTQSVGVGTATALADKASGLGWTNPSGKAFLGWATSANSGVVKYGNGASVTDLVAEGKTCDLYAVWYDAKRDYRVRYHRNVGSADKTTVLHRMAKGASTRLAWKDSQLGWTRRGYEFLGWGAAANATVAKFANGESVKDLAAVGQTLDLYAVWRPSNSYVVRLHRNLNGTDATVASQWIARGVTTRLAWKDSALGWAPAGRTFLGWAETASGAVKYANGANVRDLAAQNGVKHLYAKWTANKYTVRYHYNYGATDKTASQTFSCGTAQSLAWLDSGLKWQHPLSVAFLGWSKTADGKIDYANGARVSDLTTSNGGVIHLYAKWALITVRFHYNYGTDKTASQYFKKDAAQCLLWKDSQLKWATPSGKVFVGWGTTTNAVVAKYANGESVKNPASVGGMLNLYAVWSGVANGYTIRYCRNYTASDTTYAYQRRAVSGMAALAWKDSQLGWATPSGKTFLGWSMTRSDTAATYSNGMKIPALAAKNATLSLYAIWGSAKKSSGGTRSVASAAGAAGATSSASGSQPQPSTSAFSAGLYRGTFADGSGTFDLLVDEFDADGVATAYLVTKTEDGIWSEECEATVVGETLALESSRGPVFLMLKDDAWVAICQ